MWCYRPLGTGDCGDKTGIFIAGGTRPRRDLADYRFFFAIVRKHPFAVFIFSAETGFSSFEGLPTSASKNGGV